jgi:hypothetical protein
MVTLAGRELWVLSLIHMCSFYLLHVRIYLPQNIARNHHPEYCSSEYIASNSMIHVD